VDRWRRRILGLVLVALVGLGLTSCVSDARPVAVRQDVGGQLDVYYRHCRFESPESLSVGEADASGPSAVPGAETVVWQGEVPASSQPFDVPVSLRPGQVYSLRVVGSGELLTSFSAASLDSTSPDRVSFRRRGAAVDSNIQMWSDAAADWCVNYELPFIASGIGVAVAAIAVVTALVLFIVSRRRRKRLRKAFAGAPGIPVGVLYSRRPTSERGRPPDDGD
jgi:hypothetical protein